MVQRQQLQPKSLLALTHKDTDKGEWDRSPYFFVDGSRSPPPPGRERVFVYGTLKTGHGRNGVLQTQGSKFLTGGAKLRGWIMVDLGSFPCLVKAPHPDWEVFGELYDIEPAKLKELDRIEGYEEGRGSNRNLYDRIRVTLEGGDGNSWVYVQPNRKLIEGETNFIPRGVWYASAPKFKWDAKLEFNTALSLVSAGRVVGAADMNRRVPLVIEQKPSKTVIDAVLKSLPGPVISAPAVPSVPAIPLQVGPGCEEAAPPNTEAGG